MCLNYLVWQFKKGIKHNVRRFYLIGNADVLGLIGELVTIFLVRISMQLEVNS
jgi:hypothetical protein